MRRTKDDADLTRSQLLDAALRVFSRVGYATTRLDDIAKAAGVTRGAIAHHFGGKPDLFTALMAERIATIQRLAVEAVQGGGTPRQRLRRLMVALLQRLVDDPDYRAVQELMLFQLGAVPDELRGRHADAHREATFDTGLDRLLSAGIAAGEFRPDLDRPAVIKAILGLLAGLAVNWLAAPDAFPLKTMAEPIVDTFLAGLTERHDRTPPKGDTP
jgi:TetR/AcrR family transcriptional regulator, acrAB operon repressor